MRQAEQAPRSYSIHDSVARESADLSEASGSISAYGAADEDDYTDEDESPLGLHCLPTLSRRVSQHSALPARSALLMRPN
jgi:hypothetical protein